MSILSAFHHFLTLANKSLERESLGTFFAVRNVPIKRAKKGTFLHLEAMFSKSQKKVALKINSQAIGKPFKILLIDRCQPFGAIL